MTIFRDFDMREDNKKIFGHRMTVRTIRKRGVQKKPKFFQLIQKLFQDYC